MKQNQNLQTSSTRFHLPLLEEHIMKEHLQCKQDAIMYAGELALKNKPAKEDTDISPFITWIKSKYQQLSAFAMTSIQATNEKELGKYEFTLSEQTKIILDENIAEVKLKLRHKRPSLAAILLTYPWKKKRKSEVVVAAIASVESLLSTKAFQLFGDAFIFTLLIAITLGLALWGAAHAVPHLIRQGKTVAQRILISAIISFFVISSFYGLGILRSMYFYETGGIDINPIIFTLLNAFFFGVATTYSYFFLPTKQDEVDKERRDDLQKEIRDLETEERDLIATRDNLPAKLSKFLSERLNKMAYESNMREWIVNLCDETIGEFIRENISIRKDNLTPMCFRNLSKEKINLFTLNS